MTLIQYNLFGAQDTARLQLRRLLGDSGEAPRRSRESAIRDIAGKTVPAIACFDSAAVWTLFGCPSSSGSHTGQLRAAVIPPQRVRLLYTVSVTRTARVARVTCSTIAHLHCACVAEPAG